MKSGRWSRTASQPVNYVGNDEDDKTGESPITQINIFIHDSIFRLIGGTF